VEADDDATPTTPTDLGASVVRLAVAALLAASSAYLTGSEGVKATISESSMRNPLVRATMATAAAEEAGGRSGVRALVLGGPLVRDPCGRARKKYITISRI
jgi:hypothetical protein